LKLSKSRKNVPASSLEKSLKHKKKASSGILVPLFEEYHRQFSSAHWDSDDIDFLHDLMERVAQRERERAQEPVYSPSGLGGCMRQSFLNKHYRALEIPRKLRKKIETHYYFENGTWIHLKILVKLYKLHKAGEIELLGTEIPVRSKRGDNRGTLDAAFRRNRVFGVDIKGWNGRDFMRLAGGDCPIGTEIQVGNYIILANSDKNDLPKLEAGLVFAENKAGPVSGYPAAVCEYEIPLVATKLLVRQRLESLRAHAEEKTIPEAECRSTLEKAFKECPFSDYCKVEVKKAEARGNRRAARGDSSNHKVRVATPSRSDRTRRDRRK
jgi:hypothetical protein